MVGLNRSPHRGKGRAVVLIGEKDQTVIKKMFQALEHPVRLVVFTEGAVRPAGRAPCAYCGHVVSLTQELAGLSEKIATEIVNFDTDRERAAALGIERIPAIAVIGAEDYGIRFYGIPAGFEFATLLEAIIDVSKGRAELAPETLEKLDRIDEPVHIQVFVTPTCPYCPQAVRFAHKLALSNPNVRADMVEAQEFPELAGRYGVYGVPRTVINEETHIEGAVPESIGILYVLRAAGKLTSDEAKQLTAIGR